VIIDKYRIEHLKRHFGEKAVKNIHRGDCQRCLETLIAGKHGAARTYGLLGGILTYAVGQGYISTNPAHGVTTPADGMREFRLDADGYRTLGEALALAELRMESWQAVGVIRLLAVTGARRAEIEQLHLAEIDWDGKCLRLDDTKTGASVRPLGEPALRLLKALVNRGGRVESAWVFPGRSPRKPFNGLGDRRAGAWSRILGDGYTPHSLRHAFASACADLGLSELTISYLLGHATARTGSTTRGYIKPDAVLLAAADKVTRYIWQAMIGEAFRAEAGDALGR
jgi:integrase